MAKNCNSRNNREKIVQDLIDSGLIRVDSVSKCLHNAPRPIQTNDKDQIIRQYLFYLAFENQNEDGYHTEKLWGSLAAGVLPVYLGGGGNNHSLSFLPPNSIINDQDFSSTHELAVHLARVAANKTLYKSYHTWRTRPLPKYFVQKYNFTQRVNNPHSACRMCKWAFAKKYGLGWDHEKQNMKELAVSRSALCFAQSVQP